MKLIVKDTRLSLMGLRCFLERNNKYVEFNDYKIIITSCVDCGYKLFNIAIYQYAKRK